MTRRARRLPLFLSLSLSLSLLLRAFFRLFLESGTFGAAQPLRNAPLYIRHSVLSLLRSRLSREELRAAARFFCHFSPRSLAIESRFDIAAFRARAYRVETPRAIARKTARKRSDPVYAFRGIPRGATAKYAAPTSSNAYFIGLRQRAHEGVVRQINISGSVESRVENQIARASPSRRTHLVIYRDSSNSRAGSAQGRY